MKLLLGIFALTMSLNGLAFDPFENTYLGSVQNFIQQVQSIDVSEDFKLSHDDYKSVHLITICEAIDEETAINVLRQLANNGADLAVSTGRIGKTALHMAAYKAKPKLVRFFLNHIDVNHATKKYGFTPLSMVMASTSIFLTKDRLDIIKILLESGADVNSTIDGVGYTALHRAASRGWHQAVSLLLEYNADLRNNNNITHRTPLEMIGKQNDTDPGYKFSCSHKNCFGQCFIMRAQNYRKTRELLE